MPAGYVQAYGAKKRSVREVSLEVSRPKRWLYALSHEQADLVAACFDEDVDVLEVEGVAEVYA